MFLTLYTCSIDAAAQYIAIYDMLKLLLTGVSQNSGVCSLVNTAVPLLMMSVCVCVCVWVGDVVFLVHCLPFIGFGLLDNAIMIIAVSPTLCQ